MQDEHIYIETVSKKPLPITVIVYLIAALTWWAFIQQIILGIPFGSGNTPTPLIIALFALVGVALPVFFHAVRLRIRLDEHTLQVGLRPVHNRKIKVEDIVFSQPTTFSPLKDHGGWGIRWSPGNGMAYTSSGNTGVKLVLKNGSKVTIGSHAPDELHTSIRAVMEHAQDSPNT